MVATTSGQLNFLYPAIIIALSNAAPHLKDLQVTSSTRLVQLSLSFANPAFLLADDSHPRLLFFMYVLDWLSCLTNSHSASLRLEVLNQIVYHQFSSNPNVTYAILRAHKRFEDLGTFTLTKGLREIQRIKEAKEEAERLKAGKGDTKGKAIEMTAPVSLRAQSPGSRLSLTDDQSSEKAPLSRSASDYAIRSSSEEEADRPIPVPPTPTATSERSLSGLRLTSPPPPAGMSEKARGKMRESDSLGEEDYDPELERIAAAGVGRNGFVPTQEWVSYAACSTVTCKTF